ncbi:trypsin-like serine peptidase [Thermoactinospora rubra]|uniref:trypsin-like serine peptidase n=1 Tax=Thermoactinospora rubra TaxID=1088767 RepID=UPI000A11CC0D|nr:hypothetical protein [Thermoactinospora rubra]
MKPVRRVLVPALGGAAVLGLAATGLAAPAHAAGGVTGSVAGGLARRVADEPMARDAGQAASVAAFWLAANGAALRAASAYRWDAGQAGKVVAKGGPSADGGPGAVAPRGEERRPLGRVQNVNLPKTIGKVFFLDAAGRHRWCSATAVQSGYRNLVVTAGHCVYDTGGRDVMDKWIFVPGYYEGKAPFGVYVGKQAFTHDDFVAYEDHDRDYAFVTVHNGIHFDRIEQVDRREYERFAGPRWSRGGRYFVALSKDAGRLGDNVGGQGLAWNQAAGRVVRTFGYPAAPHPDGDKPYAGLTPKYCYGKTTGKALGASWLRIEEHVGLKCAVTPGYDGGPWLTRYGNARRLGYVNGVTSTFADQDGNGRIDMVTSPYFDGETAAVYEAAKSVWSGRIVGPNGELYE